MGAMPTRTRQDTIVSGISGASFPSVVTSSCDTYDTQTVTPTVRDREAPNLIFSDQVFYDTVVRDQPKAALGHRTQKARSRSIFHQKSETLPVVPVFRLVTCPSNLPTVG